MKREELEKMYERNSMPFWKLALVYLSIYVVGTILCFTLSVVFNWSVKTCDEVWRWWGLLLLYFVLTIPENYARNKTFEELAERDEYGVED